MKTIPAKLIFVGLWFAAFVNPEEYLAFATFITWFGVFDSFMLHGALRNEDLHSGALESVNIGPMGVFDATVELFTIAAVASVGDFPLVIGCAYYIAVRAHVRSLKDESMRKTTP